MKRREFLGLGLTLSAAGVLAKSLKPSFAAAEAKAITDKDILREGDKSTVINYCSAPDKNAKACPEFKTKPGHCKTCSFFNTDQTLADFKGSKLNKAGKYATCVLQAGSEKKYVLETAYCGNYNAKAT